MSSLYAGTSLQRRAIRAAAGLVAIVVPASAQAGSDDSGVPFTSPEGDYTVVFPGDREPRRDTDTYWMSESSFVRYDAFEVNPDFGVGNYLTLRAEVPATWPDDDALDGLLRDIVQPDRGGSLESRTRIVHRGIPGVEFVAAIAPTGFSTGGAVGRVFAADHVLWVAMVYSNGRSVDPKDPIVVAFLDSFDFVKDAFR